MGDKRALLIMLMILCSLLVALSIIETVRAAEDSWVTLTPMPTARYGLGVAVVDGKIYAIGGFGRPLGPYTNINEMYDPTTDTWTTRTPMPSSRANFGIAVVQNKIYVIGGIGYVEGVLKYPNTIEVYDPVTDTWETKSSSASPREFLVANVVNGKIYVTAGYVDSGYFPILVDRTEVYDPETDTWTTGASMPNFVGFGIAPNTASAVVDDVIYVVVSQTLRIYNPEIDTWSTSSSLLTPALNGPAAFATTGVFAPKRVHVLAGNTHQIYDPETDVWSNGTQMPTPRIYLGGAVINDRLYAIGGSMGIVDQACNEQYTPYGYIPEFPSWTILVAGFFVVAVVSIAYRYGFKHGRKNEEL